MSKKEIFFLLCLICFCNCSNPLSDEVEQVPETFPVQFSVQLSKEILPYVDTRSFPNNLIPEPRSSGDTTLVPDSGDIQSLCTCIEYVVYNSENLQSPVKHRRYTSGNSDIDFGIVYDTLPAGNYEIRFLAHSAVTDELTSNVLTFQEVTDAFYKQVSLTIGSGTEIVEDVNLQRIVGRLEFMATDSVHPNLKKFEIRLAGYPNQFNIQTGKGIPAINPFVITHLFTPSETGKKNNSHSLLTFIPETNQTMDVQLTATDFTDKLIWDYSITDVTPQINKTIRYSGKLYSPRLSNDSFTLYIENINWGETVDVPLAD